jgi:hypothetical protein
MPRYQALLIGLLLLINLPIAARTLDPHSVPEDLRPWMNWVLIGQENRQCPFLYYNVDTRHCTWPTSLQLNLNDTGGDFAITWKVYDEGWVTLPGDSTVWPQEVTDSGQPLAVTEQAGRPAAWLKAGEHPLHGKFTWTQSPEALSIPADTGLVQLIIKGTPITTPDISADGRVWLRAQDTGGKVRGETDHIEIQVYRRIIDEIPLQVRTQIELNVTGQPREMTLTGALLEGFIPLALNSPLPARLEQDGTLRLQVRPGHWNLQVTARHTQPLIDIALPASVEPWPAVELWVFDARNALRLVEVRAGTPVDPRQTTLPADWQSLPAYRMQAGEHMVFKVTRRGDPEPEPNKLALQRNLWLDYDGGGYTFNDQLSGTMTSGWRLEVNPALALGRVAVDGQPQLITRSPQSGRSGVEVRHGALNINADGREARMHTLPAIGWAHDFQHAGATLHLPPGWRLLAVMQGADQATEFLPDGRALPARWFDRWSLLDFFIVLIITVAVGSLWGRAAGLLALLTLAMIWHESGAPHQVWLHVLAAIALWRVLPAGRLRSFTGLYRNVALLVLLAIALPFMVSQIRLGIYPQLEQPWQTVGRAGPASVAAVTGAMNAPPPPAAAPEQMEIDTMRNGEKTPASPKEIREKDEAAAQPQKEKFAGKRADLGKTRSNSFYSAQSSNLYEVDPKANVQTGPGLPHWNWTRVDLSWNGPVQADQSVRLILTSPRQNLLLAFIRVLLLGLLCTALLRSSFMRPRLPRGMNAAMLMVTLLISGILLPPSPARADDFPSKELLEELKNRLLTPPTCLPACAQSPRLRLAIKDGQLELRLEVHALENVAVPLPGDAHHWLPREVTVDGRPATALARTTEGQLLLNVTPGAHQILLAGALPAQTGVQLPLPLKPHRVEIEQAGGWQIDGVHEDHTAEAQLVLTPIHSESAAADTKLEAGAPLNLPPFAHVERTLRLGLTWRVETHVTRASGGNSAIVLAVPLLQGESVLTDNVHVEGGKVQVSIPAQMGGMSYESVLEKTGTLKLSAPAATGWVETWRLDASPVLHVEPEGLAVIHHQTAEGNWLPEWRPWPGEEVTLHIARPEGIAGNTLTVDESHLRYVPGERATDVTFDLTLRSSQGGQHTLTLPEGASLQSAQINGTPQPLRQQGAQLTFPVTPGAQHLQLLWREPAGIGNRYRTGVLDLGVESVNSQVSLTMPVERWPLFVRGPRLGPAVLFWGWLIVIAGVAFGLGRVRLTPLTTMQWLLLGIGMSSLSSPQILIVAGWLLALGARTRLPEFTGKWKFNFIQIALVLLTIAAAHVLYDGIRMGLLGAPDMQIAGNGSSAYELHWYQDRSGSGLPQATVYSVPLFVYRWAMLAWALWLALAFKRWLPWAYRCFSQHGLWRSFRLFTPKKS